MILNIIKILFFIFIITCGLYYITENYIVKFLRYIKRKKVFNIEYKYWITNENSEYKNLNSKRTPWNYSTSMRRKIVWEINNVKIDNDGKIWISMEEYFSNYPQILQMTYDELKNNFEHIKDPFDI